MAKERPPLFGLQCYRGFLLDAEQPCYSPFTGAFMGPSLDQPAAVRLVQLQEVPHHVLAPTSIMALMRKIVGNIHDYILLTGGLYADTSLPNQRTDDYHFIIDVPVFENCSILRLLNEFLDRVFLTTRTVQEAYALAFCVKALSVAREEGLEWARTIDPEEFEVDCVSRTDIPGFSESYSRFKEAIHKSYYLTDWLPIYALNGPTPSLPIQQALQEARQDPDGAPLETLLLLMSLELAVDEGLAFESWDSPDVRFDRALSVAEHMPWILNGMGKGETYDYLERSLGDFSIGITRGVLSPSTLKIPTFESLLGAGHAVEEWSQRLWKYSGHDAEEEKLWLAIQGAGLEMRVEGSLDKLQAAAKPALYIEHHRDPGKNTYRLHILRGTDAPLLLEILQVEFLREQMFTGRGLVCFFDMLEGLEHPVPPEDPSDPRWRHWRLMSNIWDSTRLADPPEDGWYWNPPSCLEEASEGPTS